MALSSTPHLLFVIASLGPGGAERVSVRMANFWVQKGVAVTILTFDDGRTEPFYDLHQAVEHRALDVAGTSNNIFDRVTGTVNRILKIRSVLRQISPDAIISFMHKTNVTTVVASLGLEAPVIVTEHIDPRFSSISKVEEMLQFGTYLFADVLVGVSRPVIEYFPAPIQKKARVIHNPVVPSPEEIGSIPPPEEREPTICAMGRLKYQKGFDLLLRAFARIHHKYPQWELEIWGEGEERSKLEVMREKLGLTDHVRMPGLTSNPFEKMKRASIFVLSSRFEGFGNVIAEALACGLPVVAFDCPSGPSEILRDGKDADLVPPEDVDALSGALAGLMGDTHRLEKYARRAPEVRNRLGQEAVMSQWTSLVNQLVDNKKVDM